MKVIFLDTETSGLDPEKHRTLDIAFKVIDLPSKTLLASYDSLIYQPPEIWAEADEKSMQIHGLTPENTLGGKSEKAVSSEIINDLNHANIGNAASIFLCQNPSFDRAFFNQLISVDLQNEFHWPYHWLDLASMYWATRLHQENTLLQHWKEKELSKNAIALYFGIPPEEHPHRAKNGVNHLILCYEALFGSLHLTH